MSPAISILIPTYNAGKFLMTGLESIASQTFKDFEIIVSNDGSKDNTIQIVENFKSIHPDINVTLLNHENGGVSKARQRALEAAKGKWITFMDADDTLPENSLADLYAQTGEETDLVVGFLVPPNKPIPQYTSEDQWQKAVVEGTIPPQVWGKLYRHSLLLPEFFEIPRTITNGEDALINIAYVFAMTKPPKFLYSHIYNYAREPLSLSHSLKRTIEFEYRYDTLRLKAIPVQYHAKYMAGISKYRLNGILCSSRTDTDTVVKKVHPFFQVTYNGLKQCGYRLNLFERIALNSHSPGIIRNSALLRSILISLKYRLSSFFKFQKILNPN